jgi:hypothetical protein
MDTPPAQQPTNPPATVTELMGVATQDVHDTSRASTVSPTGQMLQEGIQYWYTPVLKLSKRGAQWAKTQWISLEARFGRRPVLAVGGGVGAVLLLWLVWPSKVPQPAAKKETIRALPSAVAPARDSMATIWSLTPQTKATANEWIARAEAALDLGDAQEVFVSLEQAVAVDPAIASNAAFAQVAVNGLSLLQPQRASKLLDTLKDTGELTAALQKASVSTNGRVRRAAIDRLRATKTPLTDETASLLLDAWQSEKCEERKMLLGKLAPRAEQDKRIAAAVGYWEKREPKCGVKSPGK